MSWETAKIGNLLAKVKRAGKLQATEYQETGRFPVIDQGQSDIAGYSDNAEIVHIEPLPIVVFGDHTRRVKLAREPFICGADGTQLLYPKDDDLDPVFFYYAVKNVDLSNYAYARHFKFLKDQEVSYPDRPTQQRIAGILSAYDDLIENNRRRIGLLEQAARLLYREWFVHLRFPGHETAKIVDGLPEGWRQGTVGELGQVITGKTPSKKVAENFGGDIPFIKTPDMHGNIFVLSSEETLSEQGAKTQSNKTIPAGAVLVSCIGSVGVVAMTSQDCQFNQQINAVVPANGISQFYCYFVLSTLKPRLEAIGGGATMANVNKSKFESLSICLPSVDAQRSFQEAAQPLFDMLLALSRQNAKLTRARDLLLPRLMDGRIPV